MDIEVGTIVKLKRQCLGNLPQTLGVCYEQYDLSTQSQTMIGHSIIFANGRYDGFSLEEQAEFLDVQGFDATIAQYEFSNVMQLSRDFENGIFDSVFKS